MLHTQSRFDQYGPVPLRPGLSLADAIRKGAAETRPCVGNFFRRHPLDGVVATCVNGAAMVALFGPSTSYQDLPLLFELYPELLAHRVRTCPADPACATFLSGPYVFDPASKPLYATLAHLNDRHLWTREQCADWLENRA